ncbi:MAG: hypothetical protein DRH97_07275 [Chloroflexi bacterium]|nr:MAG: hypothetical protein DRH97_07275 [Chloroflexota bacterium]
MKFGKQPVIVLANSEWIEPGLNTSLFNETKPNKKANKSKLSPIILILFLNFDSGMGVSLDFIPLLVRLNLKQNKGLFGLTQITPKSY